MKVLQIITWSINCPTFLDWVTDLLTRGSDWLSLYMHIMGHIALVANGLFPAAQRNLVSFGFSTIAADSVMAFDSWQTRSGPPLLCQLQESNWTSRKRKVWRYLLPFPSSLWRNLVAWHPYCDQIVGNYFLSVSLYVLRCRGLFSSSLPQGFGPWVSFRSFVESFVLVSKMEQYWNN